MTNEEHIAKLKAELRLLFRKKYRRFNVLLLNEAFEKLDETAKKQGLSKARMLGLMIKQF
jgi:hypothetical protein